jgi:hypothetical protein
MWRRILGVLVLGAMTAAVIDLGLHAPTWSRVAAVLAAAAAVPAGIWIARWELRNPKSSIGWPLLAAAAVSSTLLASAADRVALIAIVFVVVIVVVLVVKAELLRRRTPQESPS